MATLFAGVNATTLQYSFALSDTTLGQATNLLWILSLIFSIASAINSQIANHWQSSVYRSPAEFVPIFVGVWMERTPLLLLSASVISFSTGLICFCFQFFPHIFIPLVACLLTTVTSLALLIIGAWIAGERHMAAKETSPRWLYPALQSFLVTLQPFGLCKLKIRWREPSPTGHRACVKRFFRHLQSTLKSVLVSPPRVCADEESQSTETKPEESASLANPSRLLDVEMFVDNFFILRTGLTCPSSQLQQIDETSRNLNYSANRIKYLALNPCSSDPPGCS